MKQLSDKDNLTTVVVQYLRSANERIIKEEVCYELEPKEIYDVALVSQYETFSEKRKELELWYLLQCDDYSGVSIAMRTEIVCKTRRVTGFDDTFDFYERNSEYPEWHRIDNIISQSVEFTKQAFILEGRDKKELIFIGAHSDYKVPYSSFILSDITSKRMVGNIKWNIKY